MSNNSKNNCSAKTTNRNRSKDRNSQGKVKENHTSLKNLNLNSKKVKHSSAVYKNKKNNNLWRAAQRIFICR